MKRPFEEVEASRLNARAVRVEKISAPRPARSIPRRLDDGLLSRSLGRLRIANKVVQTISLLDDLNLYSRSSETRDGSGGELGVPFAVSCASQCSLTAVGHESGVVRVFDHSSKDTTQPPQELFQLEAHQNAIFDVEWSRDDRLLATASGDQSVAMIDVTTQTILRKLVGHTSTVKQVKFDPQNHNLCMTGGRDGRIAVWDFRTPSLHHGPVAELLTAHGYNSPSGHRPNKTQIPAVSITALLYKSDGQVVSACASNPILKTWDLRYLRNDAVPTRGSYPLLDPRLYSRPSKATALERLVQGESPASAFRSRGGREYGVTSLNLSHDGQRIYSMNRDGKVYEYASSHATLAATKVIDLPDLLVRTFYCKSTLSRDGLLVCGNANGRPVVIDTNVTLRSKKLQNTAAVTVAAEEDQENVLPSSISSSQSSIDTPLGRSSSSVVEKATRLEICRAGDARVSRMTTGGHGMECTGVAWSHDDSCLLTIGDDSLIRTWRRDPRTRGEEVCHSEAGGSGWAYL